MSRSTYALITVFVVLAAVNAGLNTANYLLMKDYLEVDYTKPIFEEEPTAKAPSGPGFIVIDGQPHQLPLQKTINGELLQKTAPATVLGDRFGEVSL